MAINKFMGVAKKTIILDGAMGTLLWEYGWPRGALPCQATLQRPDLVQQIHQEYLDAGADIITTNTFGAIAVIPSKEGIPMAPRVNERDSHFRGNDIREINRRAVIIARSVAGNKAKVAGDVAPCMDKKLTASEMVLAYVEQIKALADAGIDLLVLETFTDLESVQLAVHAAYEVTGGKIPLVVMMTVNENGDLAEGEDVGTLAPYLKEKKVSYFGFNCSFGPESVLRALQKWGPKMGLPLAAKPNAGVPIPQDHNSPPPPFTLRGGNQNIPPLKIRGGEGGVFKGTMTSDEFLSWAKKIVDAGAKIIGGCCGTTPEYIKKLCVSA